MSTPMNLDNITADPARYEHAVSMPTSGYSFNNGQTGKRASRCCGISKRCAIITGLIAALVLLIGGVVVAVTVTEVENAEIAAQKALEAETGQIYRGQDAPRTPYYVATLNSWNRWNGCGGVLITECHVLTAAHCVENIAGVEINAYGFLPTSYTFTSKGAMTTFNVIVTSHPNYDEDTYVHDVAMIELEECVDASEYPPVSLPPQGDDTDLNGVTLRAFGIGRQEDRSLPSVLQTVVLPFVPKDQCKKMIKKVGSAKITDDMFCAGYKEGQLDTCSGDSGGPLVDERDPSNVVLRGLTSWGYGCGNEKSPGAYASLADVTNRDFVKAFVCVHSQTLNNPLCTSDNDDNNDNNGPKCDGSTDDHIYTKKNKKKLCKNLKDKDCKKAAAQETCPDRCVCPQ